MRFCGRADEMAQIVDRWHRASKVEAPEPQLVILKAERGVGKTRLALEFYRWLSETVDRVGREGYWPDGVELLGRSIDVNPDPDVCRYDVPIPYLWWGLRAPDKEAQNAISGDAVASYDKFLAPHLVALTMRARMMQSGKALFDVWRNVAKGEAASWSGYDTVISVGEGLLKTVGILRGTLGSSGGGAREEANKRSMSRVDAVMEDLECIFNPRSFTYAKTPGVILIDDAQFSTDDPSLPVFAERLLHSAMTQSWPVLILVTHWKRDLAPEFMKNERSFAGVLHHGRARTLADNGPAAGLPGGFLTDRNTLEIDLPVVPDLSEALLDAFPGLLPEQAAALLDHAGGNPRHIEQIIAFLRENEDFFEDFDPQSALTEEGLTEALTETHDIFKVVMRRLRDAPQDVQEAICLASVQGVRFVSDTVDELARLHLGEARGEALAKAANPFSMVSARRREKISEFSERLFFMVAERRRRSLKALADEEALRFSLKAALRARLENDSVDADVEERVLTYGLAARIFSKDEPEERRFLLISLAHLAHAEQLRHSRQAALHAASLFVAVFGQCPDNMNYLEPLCLESCADLLRDEGYIEDAKKILAPLIVRHREIAEQFQTPESLRELSRWLDNIAWTSDIAGDHAAANTAFQESLEIRRMLSERFKTHESMFYLSVSLDNIGGLALKAGESFLAFEAYRESLELSRALAKHLMTPGSQRKLALALNNCGVAARFGGYLGNASADFKASLKLRHDLVERDETPGNLMDLSEALNNVGWVSYATGDITAACAAYGESIELARKLSERLKSPDSVMYLSRLLNEVGEVKQAVGEHLAASLAFGESLELARYLANRINTVESYQALSLSLRNVARAAQAEGDCASAASAYEESLNFARDVVGVLKSPECIWDVCVTLRLSCINSLQAANYSKAQEFLDEGEIIVERLPDYMKDDMKLAFGDLQWAVSVSKAGSRGGDAIAVNAVCRFNSWNSRRSGSGWRSRPPQDIRFWHQIAH